MSAKFARILTVQILARGLNSVTGRAMCSEAFIFKHACVSCHQAVYSSPLIPLCSYRRDLIQAARIYCTGMADPVVTVQQGQLKGKTGEDLHGKIYYSFQGIPYGRPPVGEHRFKAPQPAEPWTGVRDATQEGSESVSKHMIFYHPIGSEDCLNLNVYTPQLPSGNSAPKAVMVWIHGGGFTMGSNKTEIYGPQFLVDQDIVLVSINYRLGILGFLSLEDTSLGVPGNAGLKDMVLALKWVQNNISRFGGDPNNVTIFGESAGSAACHLLVLSPMAKGLFHRAILQSGAVINPWVFGLRNAIQIANVLGNECTTEKQALEFLRTVPIEKFHEAQELIKDPISIDEQRPFCPVIEKPNSEAFLTQDPMSLMLSGNYNKVPMIIGYTSREGMLMEVIQKKENNGVVIYRMKNFERAIPMTYVLEKGSEDSLKLAKKIQDFYYGNSKSAEDDVDCYYQMTSDAYFTHGIQNSLKAFLKSTNQPIYFYRFSVETDLNIYKKIGNITAPGACHADDLGYLFQNMMTPAIDPSTPEGIAVHRMTTWWTNFAKTGNPNPSAQDPLISVQWPPVTLDAYNALDINRDLSLVSNPEQDRMQFWDNVAAAYSSKL